MDTLIKQSYLIAERLNNQDNLPLELNNPLKEELVKILSSWEIEPEIINEIVVNDDFDDKQKLFIDLFETDCTFCISSR